MPDGRASPDLALVGRGSAVSVDLEHKFCQSFSETYLRYGGWIKRRIEKGLGYDQDSTGVHQQAWLLAWEKRHQFQGRSSLQTWVLAIALKLAHNKRRSKHRSLRTGTEDAMLRSSSRGENQSSSILLREVLEAVDRMTSAHRNAVALRCVLGMSEKEVEAVGFNGSSVSQRLVDARMKLRSMFGATSRQCEQ